MPNIHRLALPVESVVGSYRIDGILGEGGFGITYLASHTTLGRRTALKELLPVDLATRIENHAVAARTSSQDHDFEWAKDRFLDEARSLACFHHPNIVTVHDVFEANGTAYMATSYQEGSDLSTWLDLRNDPLSESEIRNLLSPLLQGLEVVHADGILHRDIKPGNVYICRTGQPVLLDFGSARQAISSKSRPMTSIITPGYAPFEQYHDDGNQGPWTDLYAFGALLFRMITGEKPPDAARRVRNDPCPALSEVCAGSHSKTLLTAVDWALRPNEEDRPQTVLEWREALQWGGGAESTNEVGPAARHLATMGGDGRPDFEKNPKDRINSGTSMTTPAEGTATTVPRTRKEDVVPGALASTEIEIPEELEPIRFGLDDYVTLSGCDEEGREYRFRFSIGELSQKEGGYLVGRSKASADFVIDSESVSRSHAQVYYNREVETLCVIDLDSANGTWVNGRRLMDGESVPFWTAVEFGEVHMDVARAGKSLLSYLGFEASESTGNGGDVGMDTEKATPVSRSIHLPAPHKSLRLQGQYSTPEKAFLRIAYLTIVLIAFFISIIASPLVGLGGNLLWGDVFFFAILAGSTFYGTTLWTKAHWIIGLVMMGVGGIFVAARLSGTDAEEPVFFVYTGVYFLQILTLSIVGISLTTNHKLRTI